MKALAGSLKVLLHQDYLGNTILKRVPVFIQYSCTYFVIVILMFIILLTVSGHMKEIAINSYLDQVNMNLEASAASFELQIENFKSISFALDEVQYYSEIRTLNELQL